MKISDLESKIEEPRKDLNRLQDRFTNHIFTDDNKTRYSTIVTAVYSESSAYGNIKLKREDIIKTLKTKYKIRLFPRPKLLISKEPSEEYNTSWKINIGTTYFVWTINDWDRWKEEGTYGIVGNYSKIANSIKAIGRKKNILIKDDLINLLTAPVSEIHSEFLKYLKTKRIPMIEKGIIRKTIIYSDELQKIRELRPNWDI